jgi:hypothetical protein
VPSCGGLKPLRRALLLTAEWNCAAAREAAARALEAADPSLPVLRTLRERLSRDLSKAQLLQLCRLWGYRSDAWQAKGSRRRKRVCPGGGPTGAAGGGASPRASPPPQQQLVALPPPPRLLPLPALCAPEAAAVRGFLDAQLLPLLRGSASALAGPASRALTLSGGVAPFTPRSLDAYDTMTRLCRGLAARWDAAAAAQRAWAAPALTACGDDSGGDGDDGNDECTAAAWALLPRCGAAEAPAAAHLRELDQMLHSGARMLQANSAAALLGAATEADVPIGFSAAQEEYGAALRDGAAFVAAAALLLAQLRAAASLACYAAAGEQVLCAAAAYAGGAADAFAARRAWSNEALHGPRGAQRLDKFVTPEREWSVLFTAIDVTGGAGAGAGGGAGGAGGAPAAAARGAREARGGGGGGAGAAGVNRC